MLVSRAMSHLSFEPIGVIESCFPARFGTPRQPGLVPDAWAVLRLRPELSLADGLDGLAGFSHVWLLFVFHKNESRRALTKVHPPRLGGRKLGVFATRSPHRPNPIGLSAVRLERIDGNDLYLSGVDMVSGTPVLDVKPYVPYADALIEARADWAEAPARALEVRFDSTAAKDLQVLRPQAEARERLERLIQQTIALDPRAIFLKGTVANPNPYTDRYGVYLEDLNVVFRVAGGEATVVCVEPASAHAALKDSSGTISRGRYK